MSKSKKNPDTKKCAYCHREFKYRGNKKYCRPSCRTSAWSKRVGWTSKNGYFNATSRQEATPVGSATEAQTAQVGNVSLLNLEDLHSLNDKFDAFKADFKSSNSRVNFNQTAVNAIGNKIGDAVVSYCTPEQLKNLNRREFRAALKELTDLIVVLGQNQNKLYDQIIDAKKGLALIHNQLKQSAPSRSW